MLLVRRGPLEQADLDGSATRVRVIQRHREVCALQAGASLGLLVIRGLGEGGEGGTVPPGQALIVEPLQPRLWRLRRGDRENEKEDDHCDGGEQDQEGGWHGERPSPAGFPR